MTLEDEKKFLLLLSSYDSEKHKSTPTKSDVLDNITSKNWIKLSTADEKYKSNRKELVWRNDLAFVRKHLEQQGLYVSGERNNWGITINGIIELKRLNSIVQKTNVFNKITLSAKLYASHEFTSNTTFTPIPVSTIIDIENFDSIAGAERLALIKARVNQCLIRKNSIRKYNCKCALCGMKMEEMLVASHIKSWSDSTPNEKGDINNILLLCANHDALFDKHLISFNDNGTILINNKMDSFDKSISNININMSLSFEMSPKMREYMQYHRGIFKKLNI